MTRIFSILIAVLFLSVGLMSGAPDWRNRALAMIGNAEAQYKLGAANYSDAIVAEDYYEAAKWYRLAAEQGHIRAQYELGLVLNRGCWKKIRLTNDPRCVPGIKWYRLAAQQGYAPAASTLGVAYSKGKGVQQDLVRAYMWHTLALIKEDTYYHRQQRDKLTEQMTPEQILQAQRSVPECFEKRRQDIDC